MSKPIKTVEELDAVLHWRRKHALAIKERDALQHRLTAADEREDAAIALVTRLIECAGGQPSIATGYLRDILDALKPEDGVDAHDATKDLSCYFGLTYASWLTLPRVLMESMPDEWKRSMATLLNQYEDAYQNQPSYGTTVRVTVDGKMVRTPEWLINYRHPDRSMINQVRGLSG
ncbi:hypothetical protein [Pseudomonas sp. WCS374]|uniref:hypothetical protein n=1 Tax=Pseudomonas sp. WCS374 TaxID=1495331 RepID=UPI00049B41A6|nr:hypothetical protein [Pseudomonas sp. WCS374]AIB40815.1 hypothetical protein PD374_07015 [Pseudomonas sp. WCS374]